MYYGCGDNSCIFECLNPCGVGTNGGCQCFQRLMVPGNREEVRKVELLARALALKVHKLREQIKVLSSNSKTRLDNGGGND